jgi:uncharacterized protein (DUF1684 family)
MKTNSLLIAALLMATSAFAQATYTDSIKAYQKNYVEALYPIIKNDTAFIRFYRIQETYRVKAKVAMLANQQTFKMVTSSGTSKDAVRLAVVTFTLNGKQQKLYAYQLQFLKDNATTANLFFIPFIDGTSNNDSYAGGRYLDFELGDIQHNELVIDFNKAYNPYCAFASGYNCPIPPRENTLTEEIKAGERYWKEKFHH